MVGVATGGFAFGFGPGLRRCFAEEGGTGAVDGDGDIDAELMVRTVLVWCQPRGGIVWQSRRLRSLGDRPTRKLGGQRDEEVGAGGCVNRDAGGVLVQVQVGIG